MKTKGVIIIGITLLMLTLFVVNYSEAIEVQPTKLEQLLPKCNGKILSQDEFVRGKYPFTDVIGKCVKFSAVTFKMISAKSGFFNIGNNHRVVISFKEAFRGYRVEGIAKIKGLLGVDEPVPYLEMLEIEKIIGR